MGIIISRRTELELLDSLMDESDAQLLAVYGRRRIGKTYLISNYFSDKGVYFELTGSEKLTIPEQILNFMFALLKKFICNRLTYRKPKNSYAHAIFA